MRQLQMQMMTEEKEKEERKMALAAQSAHEMMIKLVLGMDKEGKTHTSTKCMMRCCPPFLKQKMKMANLGSFFVFFSR